MVVSSSSIRACLLLAAVLFAAPPTSAQDSAADAQTQERSAEADRLFEEGKQHGKAKEWEAAYQALAKAYALKPSYDIAANLATAAYETRRFPEAAQRMRYALEVFPATGDAAKRAQVEAFLAKVEARVAKLLLEVEPSDAEVSITSAAPDAHPGPTPIYVKTGLVKVKVTRTGYVPSERVLETLGGHEYPLRVVLEKVVEVPEAPAVPPDPRVDEKPKPTPAPLWPIWVGGGVTVAATVVGGVFTLAGDKRQRDADRLLDSLDGTNPCASGTTHVGPCADIEDAIDERQQFHRAAVITTIGAAVVGATTIGYSVYALKTRKRSKVTVQALPGGVSIGGTF